MSDSPPIGVDLPGVFENSADPLFAVNAQRRIVFFNSACVKLTGVARDQALGVECRFHGPVEGGEPASLAGSLCPPHEALEGKPAKAHALVIQPGGERSWRCIEFLPCLAADGSLSVILGRIGEPEPESSAAETPRETLLRLRQRLWERYGFDGVVAVSPPMQRALEQVKLASQNQAPVLLVGEEGTGKERLARIIHSQGPQRQRSFLALDCAALPLAALERELGQAASFAAVYLKEPAALARDLQEQVVRRLDEAKGPRWLAGSTRDPANACAGGELLETLYYRLTAQRIELPPLRDRGPDLPLLVQQVLERCNAAGGKQVLALEEEATEFVRAYSWPGNLTELETVLAAAHARTAGRAIRLEDIPLRLRHAVELAAIPSAPPLRPLPLDALLENAERRLIELALREAHGSKTKAAERLHITRARLHRRMQLLGIAGAEEEPGEQA